jgi:two-component system, NarL family, sensor histidine kinase DegS
MTDIVTGSLTEIIERINGDIASVSAELQEIEMLVAQTRTEAGRHEERVAHAAERVAQLAGSRSAGPREVTEANAQLLAVTRKSIVMRGSLEVLEGKVRVLARYREKLEEIRAMLEAAATHGDGPQAPDGTQQLLAPAVSRIVLTAQEDLRREIARAMHDGPAQSLTNIVMQAQIVQRLVGRDDEAARVEAVGLVAMVERTLEATKTFIFDVRPMVLDDLGLVPTLRRSARDRSRRAQVPVEFDSVGADRRLSIDVESTLFRIIDETIVGFTSTHPERVSLRLDWGDRLIIVIAVPYDAPQEGPEAPAGEHGGAGTAIGEEVPPALAAMMREATAAALPRVRSTDETRLPADTWRDAQERASTIGATVSLDDDGHRLRLEVDVAAHA